ncbi:divalent-cation tolerance protein CutA [Kibdelosporangium lantanae]|uniref:Divalent-cation tolerance protein CutA n=1 Tax=Kibdelosporangium lantanae TaxID=1497396 RepID=A0ABW3M5A3_9PSEU
MTDYLRVVTAAESREVAHHLARSAVEARLAAGAQVHGPVTSFFWHNDASGSGEEWQVTLTTTAERYPALENHLLAEHSWNNPEISAVPIVRAPQAYFDWLEKFVTPE